MENKSMISKRLARLATGKGLWQAEAFYRMAVQYWNMGFRGACHNFSKKYWD